MAKRRRHSYQKIVGSLHRCSFCGVEKQTTKGAGVFRKHSSAEWQDKEPPCADPNQVDFFAATSVADREETDNDFYQLATVGQRKTSETVLETISETVPPVGRRENSVARVIDAGTRRALDAATSVRFGGNDKGQRIRAESGEDIVGLALRTFPGSSILSTNSADIPKFDGHIQLTFAERFNWMFVSIYNEQYGRRLPFEATEEGGRIMALRLIKTVKKWPLTVAALYKEDKLHSAWQWDGSDWCELDVERMMEDER